MAEEQATEMTQVTDVDDNLELDLDDQTVQTEPDEGAGTAKTPYRPQWDRVRQEMNQEVANQMRPVTDRLDQMASLISKGNGANPTATEQRAADGAMDELSALRSELDEGDPDDIAGTTRNMKRLLDAVDRKISRSTSDRKPQELSAADRELLAGVRQQKQQDEAWRQFRSRFDDQFPALKGRCPEFENRSYAHCDKDSDLSDDDMPSVIKIMAKNAIRQLGKQSGSSSSAKGTRIIHDGASTTEATADQNAAADGVDRDINGLPRALFSSGGNP